MAAELSSFLEAGHTATCTLQGALGDWYTSVKQHNALNATTMVAA